MDWYNAPIKVGTSSDTVIAKAREISNTLNIAEEDFKAPWGWLAHFRSRKGLGLILLHGEEAKIDKESPELLSCLNMWVENCFRKAEISIEYHEEMHPDWDIVGDELIYHLVDGMEEFTVDDINGFVHAHDADSDFYKLWTSFFSHFQCSLNRDAHLTARLQ